MGSFKSSIANADLKLPPSSVKSNKTNNKYQNQPRKESLAKEVPAF